MGHAYKAPNPSYKPHYYISEHAVERLRDRSARMIGHLDEHSLRLWIDSAVHSSVRAGRVEYVVDEGDTAQLVALEEEVGEKLYALLKKNYLDKTFEMAVVTILSEEVMSKLKQSRWNTSTIGAIHGDKLAAVAVRPKKAVPEPGPDTVAASKPKKGGEGEVLITFDEPEEGGKTCYQAVPASEATDRVNDLVSKGYSGIRVWREVSVKIRVEVDLDL